MRAAPPRLALGCALWGKDKSQAFG